MDFGGAAAWHLTEGTTFYNIRPSQREDEPIMKASVETINPVQRRIKIELAPEAVNKAFHKAYMEIQRKAQIQGFRPGKAPIQMIRKLYGKSVISDVTHALVNDHIFVALKENQVNPVSEPVIEAVPTPAQDQAFEFSAIVDVMPEVKLKTYKDVAVVVEKFEASDSDVEREISVFQRRHAKTRAVEPGTRVDVGLSVTLSHSAQVDGKPFPGLSAEHMTVELGRGEMFPELEAGIKGMGIGERKTIALQLPESYQDAELAGKKVDVEVEINDMQSIDLPKLDDEFAKDVGFASKDEMVAKVRTNLQKNATDMRRQRLEKSVLDVLIQENPFEVPPSIVDSITDNMIQQFRFKNDQDMRNALKDNSLRENMRPGAKRQAQEMFILSHVAREEKVDVTDGEIEKHLDQMFAGGQAPDQDEGHVHDENCQHDHGKRDPKTSQMRNQMRRRVHEHLTLSKAMDVLISHAKVANA